MKKLKPFLGALLLCALISSHSFGQTVQIGLTSYGTITEALAAATSGDVIEVRGIHTESITIDKSITLRGSNPATDIIQAAATAGSATARVISINGATNSYAITLENLGVRYGNASANGGGIDIDKNQGTVTLRNLIIENNATSANGGGLSLAGSNVDIIECTIRNNTAALDGGGFILAPNNGVIINSDINIHRSLINGNTAANGGGIYINGNKDFGNNRKIDVYLENTTISNNSATSLSGQAGGGGIWSKSAFWTEDPTNTTANVTLQMVHCTMYNNTHTSALKNGIQFTSTPSGALTNFSIYNSIVVTADDVAQKALNFANSNTTEVINCILGGLNAVPGVVDISGTNNAKGQTATFAGISTSLSDEWGNVQVLALTPETTAVNYCIATTGITLPTTDARGKVRDAEPDAGAFELNSAPVVANAISDVVLGAGFGTSVVDLANTFSDVNSDALALAVSVSDESVVTASLSGTTLNLFEEGQGAANVTVTATDPEGASVSATFSVEVNPTVQIGSTSYNTITEALNAAVSSEVIEIRGVHTETITIDKSVTIRGTDPAVDIIQAAATPGTASSGVIRVNGGVTNYDITLENIGVRHGNSSGNGGGIDIDKNKGSVTLKNLIISDNATSANGGGVSVAGSNVDFIECTIRNNAATQDGGGIILASNNTAAIDNSISIQHSLIDSNTGRNGGGIYLNGNKDFGDNQKLDVQVVNTTISNNHASSAINGNGGGAIWSKNALLIRENIPPTGNVTLQMVHTTVYNNSHASSIKNGLQFTSTSTEVFTNFSIYNSIVVTADDVTQKALNFANTNTTEVVNCILGGLNALPPVVTETRKNNLNGTTATYAGINTILSNEGGNVPVLALTNGSNAKNYCTVSAGIAFPTVDARNYTRDDSPDAGAFEFIQPPINLVATPSSANSISLSWSVENPAAPVLFQIWRSEVDESPNPAISESDAKLIGEVSATGATSYTYVDANLAPGKTYYYAVRYRLGN